MGIDYNSIFPISVHSLPNGSIIYRLQTSNHSKYFITAIDGPLKSFNQTMANNANLSGFTHLSVNLREIMAMKEEVSAVKHNEFWAPELNELNVKDTEDCVKDKEKEENSEVEIAENDLSCG